MAFGSPYKRVGSGEGKRCRYPVRFDVYGRGCEHNCAYCYARGLLEFRNLWNPERPPSLTRADLERILLNHPRGIVLRLGGMTDCFMPQERERRVTYETLKLLRLYRQPHLIVTKGDILAEPDYLRILDPGLAQIQISVTTLSEESAARIEPGAPAPRKRIAALERLTVEGFDAQLRVSPLIPHEAYYGAREARDLPAVACPKVLVEFLRVNSRVLKRMPDLPREAFSIKAGGYSHLPLERKIEYLAPFKAAGKRVTVCEDVPEHYRFFQRCVNANPGDCCDRRE